jgi:hypothetical protein
MSDFGAQPDVNMAVRHRFWGDATFGTLSSDGQHVFAIEDLSLNLSPPWANRFMFRPNRRSGPWEAKPYNRLAAYDVRTGKLAWHLGGAADELGLPQAGTFFLGSPLPLGGQIYVLGELKGDPPAVPRCQDGQRGLDAAVGCGRSRAGGLSRRAEATDRC